MARRKPTRAAPLPPPVARRPLPIGALAEGDLARIVYDATVAALPPGAAALAFDALPVDLDAAFRCGARAALDAVAGRSPGPGTPGSRRDLFRHADALADAARGQANAPDAVRHVVVTMPPGAGPVLTVRVSREHGGAVRAALTLDNGGEGCVATLPPGHAEATAGCPLGDVLAQADLPAALPCATLTGECEGDELFEVVAGDDGRAWLTADDVAAIAKGERS